MSRAFRTLFCLGMLFLFSGCTKTGEYRLHLVFVDSQAESLVSEVGIWVLRPGGHQCAELIEGEIRPGEMSIQAELEVSYPVQGGVQLDQVPTGEMLFFAEGRTEEGGQILRGCTSAEVKGGATVDVTVQLDWICHPDPAGEIPNNGLDDDCDGLTDNCQDAAICDDDNLCTSDFCSGEECQHTNYPSTLLCDDQDPCTLDDHCQEGSCQGTPKDCSAYDGSCQVGVCDSATGQCTTEDAEDGSDCSDGRFCTIEDSCFAGECVGENQTCDDSDPCTRDVCNDAVDECQNPLEPVPGAEGLQVPGSCDNQLDDDCDGLSDDQDPNCLGCVEDSECDDGNACTTDGCVDNQCQNTVVDDGNPCSDGQFCTSADACNAGVCRGVSRDCSHLDGTCLVGVCSEAEGQCLVQAMDDGTACEDGLFCTVQDVCSSGACQGVARDCADSDICTRDECNEGLDRCDHMIEANPGAEGPPGDASCNNGVDDDCDGLTDLDDGSCSGCAGSEECDDGNPCTDDLCDVEGECSNPLLDNGRLCDDGLYCSERDVCTAGVCGGPARDCDDAEPCTLDECDEDADSCLNTWQEQPQEEDVCLDGLDQDCNGVADDCCLGNGDLQQTTELAMVYPFQLVTGDFNADKIPDLIGMKSSPSGLEVFLGNGINGQPDGTFSHHASVPSGPSPRSIVTGDFNSDHILDLAVTTDEFLPDERLSIYLGSGSNGQGDGGFLARVNYPAGEYPYGMIAADFNADGITDLAVTDLLSAGVVVLLGQGANGQGDGSFAAGVLYASGDTPFKLAAADFNSDRILDLAVVNLGETTFSILLGQGQNGRGDGTFAAPMVFVVDLTAGSPADIALGDFNSDRIHDVAISTSAATIEVLVYLGGGSDGQWDGSFSKSFQNFVPGSLSSAVEVADLNRDGIDDVIATSAESDQLTVVVGSGSNGQGDGSFSSMETFGVGSGARTPLVADLDLDHILDVAVPNQYDDTVSILWGSGSGSRAAGTFLPRSDTALSGEGEVLAVGDFNADNILDLAVYAEASPQPVVQIFLGSGSDGRGDGSFVPSGQKLVGEVKDIEVADLDRDGNLDLLVLNDGADDSVGVLLGRGDGTFLDMFHYLTGQNPWTMVTGDFNSDGIVDVAVSNIFDLSVSILLGNLGSAPLDYWLSSRVDYDLGTEPYWLCAADFNSDHITDLAVPAPSTGAIKLLVGSGGTGQGDGAFLPPVDISTLTSPMAVACRDFNNDGHVDMLVNSFSEQAVAWHQGRGDGTFETAVNSAAAKFTMSNLVADFDGDGILDVMLASTMVSEIHHLKGNGQNGRGDGTFSEVGSYAVDSVQLYVLANDFNADGVLDLAVPNSAAESFSILPGQAECLTWVQRLRFGK